MIKLNLVINNVLIFLLIAISGMPFFLDYELSILWFLNCLFGIYIVVSPRKVNVTYLIFIASFLGFTFLHYILFGFYPFITVIGIVARINAAYFVFTFVGKKFMNVFVNQIFILSTLSLFFTLVMFLGPGMYSLMRNSGFVDNTFTLNNFIIYVFSNGYRNNGPFWEPGAFVGFIIVSFIFYHSDLKRFSLLNSVDLVLFITLITTFSTTGYLSFMLFYLGLYILNSDRSSLTKTLVLPIIFTLFFSATFSFNFISEKITQQLMYAEDYNFGSSKYTSSRFVNFYRDFDQIKRKPFFGWGVSNVTRLENESFTFANVTNGTTDFCVRYGIVGFILFSLGLYYCFRRLGFSNSQIIFTIALLYFISFSEAFFRYSFFLGLPFLTGLSRKHTDQIDEKRT